MVLRNLVPKLIPSMIFIIVILSIMPLNGNNYLLMEVNERMEQLDGDGTIEERCSSITFEDIFEYTHANFNFQIDEDLNSAEVSASAWINWSMADTVRERLDSFLAGILPSGGDGWLSTDERDAVLGIASDCIEHTLTRIGIRDGPPHRGGVGVDWKNTTWESGSINVDEINGIPLRHSEGRVCESWQPGDQCYEVPVNPSEDRDCDTDIDNSLLKDECQFLLYLNATMLLPGLSELNSFTLVLNASNMSNADLNFNFPSDDDLRLDMWEECEGRYLGQSQSVDSDQQSPLRGSCVGDSSTNFTVIKNIQGSTNYSIFLDSQSNNWPEGEDIFADFTTSPIPVDNSPLWTENAPKNDSWIPSQFTGEIMWATWSNLSSWFEDEKGASNLDIICRGPNSSSVFQKSDRSYWANLDNLLNISCEAIDSIGQSTGNRTWHLGNPLIITTSNKILQNPHIISLDASKEWPPLSVSVMLTQGGPESFSTVIVDSLTEISLISTSMIPGPVYVKIIVEGDNIYRLENIYDLGIIKESSPPYISIGESHWTDNKWSSNGQFSDPDGEDVTFTLFVNNEVTGALILTGNSWQTPELNFELWPEGEHEVKIQGCDISSKCSDAVFLVNNTHLWEQELEIILEPQKSERSIPSSGIMLLMLSFAGALMYIGRRE
ncbi:MAG: hypothetical protein NLN64_02080 [Candidatus Thalassarchaeaceae archaeon]|nr:hypothetical protein [Candidatus Thalassarchaeaceae archaeon]